MRINKKQRRFIKSCLSRLVGKKSKQVTKIPEQARFGNILYFFLNCFINRKRGINAYILHTNTMDYWLQYFPLLKTFVVFKDEFAFYDNLDWFTSYHQEFNTDYTLEELNEFISLFLIDDILENETHWNRTIINIRRGDFYSETEDLPSSFDQIKYVNKALESFPEILNYPVEIISDNIDWCLDNIKFSAEGASAVLYKRQTAFADFISICTCKNLLVTNSTFSYWGGYINKCRKKEGKVIAPSFGATFYHNHRAVQLHPEWDIIEITK